MSAAHEASLPVLARHDDVLVWHVPDGWRAISSAVVGGGIVRPRWVLNAGVEDGFARTDLAAWADEVAAGLGLTGPTCALLTAADVSQVQQAERGGVRAWATVGVTKPTWPHDPRAPLPCSGGRQADGTAAAAHVPAVVASAARPTPPVCPPGTVNIVVALPLPLSPSALVQAVGTVTEAKAQVLVQAGVPGTGTASDAVVVLCPAPDDSGESGGAPFAGVRSVWGRHIAHAVHDAVLTGLATHPRPATGEEHVW